MKTSGLMALVAMASLAVASCTTSRNHADKSSATLKATKSMAVIYSTGSFLVEPCPTTAPPQANDQKYTLTLGPNFQMRHADASHGGHTEGPSKPIPKHNATLLDIFTQLDGTTSQWATVTINLAQNERWLHFRTDEFVVRAGEEKAPICGVKLDPPNPVVPLYDPRWVSFRTHRDTAVPTSATYNLGLIVKDDRPGSATFELPVFIDPGVDNEG